MCPVVLTFAALQPPDTGVFRIARRSGGAVDPLAWEYALPDGTFGNRFDDPAAEGASRFRVVYCAASPQAAFGETLARFRPSLDLLANLRDIADDTDEDFDELIFTSSVIPADWRLKRQIASAAIAHTGHSTFVDIDATASQQLLREHLVARAMEYGLHDVDEASITGQMRAFTQSCPRFIYEQTDQAGTGLYAGIRYRSRLNPEWECWACFSDRVLFDVSFPRTIDLDDEALLDVARLFHLSIETFNGHVLEVRTMRKCAGWHEGSGVNVPSQDV